LKELCGISYRITDDREAFQAFNGLRIAYSDERITEETLHIKPCGLLFEDDLHTHTFVFARWQDCPVFFLTGGDIPFDIFSASFYLMSRYEEYLPHEKDVYGRFAHKQSLAFRYNFLHLPLVELWAQGLRSFLTGSTSEPRVFRFQPTYDIDQAWCWKHKGFRRNAGGLFRDLFTGNWKQAVHRIAVLRNKKPDPFEVYEWMDALHLKHQLRPFYFFMVAKQNGLYDKHILPSVPALRELIHYHTAGYRTGIHPSWASGEHDSLLQEEVLTFSDISGESAEYSRYHYLRFEVPGGYRRLLRLGIHHDFSMGYGTINGFRASTSIPFLWFDLETNEETDLLIHPFCWMDANSFYEQNETPARAFEELCHYRNVLKKVSGQMLVIWHNNFFGSDPSFTGWKEVYELFLENELYWEI
jgi:hypothetical protein